MKYSLPTIRTEVLCGLTVSLALVPEAISFAFAAGVPPIIGVYTSFIIGLIMALFGGRPGVISGSAGAVAVVVVYLSTNFGLNYVFAAVILSGLIQLLIGALHLGKLIRLVPHPALLGFINGLAIVIFAAQFKQLKVDGQWLGMPELQSIVPLILLTMLICAFWPRLTKKLPGPLAGIGITTFLVLFFQIDTRTVGDLANISGTLPAFHVPKIPITVSSLEVIIPVALIMALIGVIENLLLLNMVSDITEGKSSVQSEVYALGLANLTTGFFGGMGGCASIGQSVINVTSGARHRISGTIAASMLMVYVLFAADYIEMIPISALIGVMFFVVIKTFVWSSFKLIGKVPASDTLVMLIVTVVTVLTDIATAVIIGSILSALAYAWKASQRIHIKDDFTDEKGCKVYQVEGPLFFASVTRFKELFNPEEDPNEIIIDFANSRVVDQSGIQAIDKLAERYIRHNKRIHLKHLSADCAQLLGKASAFVEHNQEEDPHYGLVMDYNAPIKIETP
jgi:SulP family sulfate permease